MTRIAILVLTGNLVTGCAPDGPLGTVGAIVTVPITAPVMFVSAQRVCEVCDHGPGDLANAALGRVSARPCTR